MEEYVHYSVLLVHSQAQGKWPGVILFTADSLSRNSRVGLCTALLWSTNIQLPSKAQNLLRVPFKEMILRNMDGVKIKKKRYRIEWKNVEIALSPDIFLVFSTQTDVTSHDPQIGPTRH
jgi:hypothetical protein